MMWMNKQFPPKTDLILPSSMRQELKTPLGQLITKEPTTSLLTLITKEQPPLVVLVGDYCVQDFLEAGGVPNLSIIDHKNLRKPFEPITIPNAQKIITSNPPATITIEAWMKIRKIIQQQLLLMDTVTDQQKKKGARTKQTAASNKHKAKNPVVLFVEGEEDLLVLPVVLESPEGVFVVYGQPHRGIVLIKVTSAIKDEFAAIINKMEPIDRLNSQ